MKFISRIKFRNDTAANWTAANPVLLRGEAGFEYDTGKFKVGDGSTTWNSLAYSSGEKGDKGDPGEKGDTVVGPAGPNQVSDATESLFGNGVLISDAAGNVDVVLFGGDSTKYLSDDGTMSVPPSTGGGLSQTELLRQWTAGECYQATSATFDSDGVVTTATVLWPDGATGTFTRTAKNSTFSVVDAYTITHVTFGKTVTQATVTRDSSGNVTTKPALTIA